MEENRYHLDIVVPAEGTVPNSVASEGPLTGNYASLTTPSTLYPVLFWAYGGGFVGEIPPTWMSTDTTYSDKGILTVFGSYRIG